MLTTTYNDERLTIAQGGKVAKPDATADDLIQRYLNLLNDKRLAWTAHHKFKQLLGTGGQGVVFLTERRGADGFTLPVAIKIFSPEHFKSASDYEAAMSTHAHIAARVAQIQQHNLLDVQNFVDRNRVRMMVMEWIDGYDLRRLLVPKMLERIRARVSQKRWETINRVVVTAGPSQPRIKPGIAVAIVRDCLAALAALHREDIVHGDIKPSNIMLKCTGTAKIIDIGSAFEIGDPPAMRSCTPAFAAPEVLEGNEATPRSDLASLGYVLIEMLSGRPVFKGITSYRDLLEAKRQLHQDLDSILPQEVTCNTLLMSFCRGLIATDPMKRFPSAEAANVRKGGAAAFQRQLVMSDLASEYDNEILHWLQELRELDAMGDETK